MNIKVAAFKVSKKSINNRFALCEKQAPVLEAGHLFNSCHTVGA